MPTWVTALFKPVADVVNKRTERKMAKEALKGKLALAMQDNEYQLEVSDAEWEAIGQQLQGQSWKDEYVTVSLVSILNLIVVGGILAAFGHAQLLTGLGIALTAITNAGVDFGFLLTAVVLAAIGLKVWRA